MQSTALQMETAEEKLAYEAWLEKNNDEVEVRPPSAWSTYTSPSCCNSRRFADEDGRDCMVTLLARLPWMWR